MERYILFLLFTFFTPCVTYAMDGNGLLEDCTDAMKIIDNDGYATNMYRAAQQQANMGECIGYIAGITDALDGLFFCTPHTATYGQFSRIVIKYLRDNPEKLNESTLTLVTQALSKAFPCSKPAEKQP